ncbi:MAG: hypothetical protein ACRD8W_32290, partial [Nitrososphaeraceae archaeon]
MSEMAFDTGSPIVNLILILSGIGSGTAAVTFLEWYLNKKSKEREEYITTSRDKISHISATKSHHNEMAGYSIAFSKLIKPILTDKTSDSVAPILKRDDKKSSAMPKETIETERCLYFLCNFVRLYQGLTSHGNLQLDD